MLDKGTYLSGQVVACHHVIGSERIYLGHRQLYEVNDEGDDRREKKSPVFCPKSICFGKTRLKNAFLFFFLVFRNALPRIFRAAFDDAARSNLRVLLLF